MLIPKKCKVMETSVTYSDHIISKSADKTEEVRNRPTARCAEEVCRVLGLAGTFVKGFTDIIKPLYILQNMNNMFIY